ncbi:MAG: type II toxin-antitoxin system RelE/ParE family toxin [Caldilineales bacterium]|nr:type II toxin-antitoxin system RelE/ParE family toxin [Caldilineales bacterium]MCW5857905.1 type II toxin-antitoxin system RelE/ParE family toxin [Caldilineales bacterium]
MVFIETPLFTKLVSDYLSDEEYAELQQVILLRPEAGTVIPGSGGLRKLRWAVGQQGKRGGLRVIYYWVTADSIIYLLFLYRKNEQEDLTPDQLSVLRRLIKEYLT